MSNTPIITGRPLSSAFTVSIHFLNNESPAVEDEMMKSVYFREQWVMALRLRGSKDVKKSFYYVWYLGAREAKGVDAMPRAIAYLLERERLQEPFKVTLQVSGTILKSGFGSAHRKYHGNESTIIHAINRPKLVSIYHHFLFPSSSSFSSSCVSVRVTVKAVGKQKNKRNYDLIPQVRSTGIPVQSIAAERTRSDAVWRCL